MNLLGELNYYDEIYYLYMKDQKSKEIWYLVSPTHKEDITAKFLGEQTRYPVFTLNDATKEIPEDYIIEAVSRAKVSGKVSSYGKVRILEDVLKTISYCKSYSFPSNKLVSRTTIADGNIHYLHEGRDTKVYIEYKTINKLYDKLSLKANNVIINMHSCKNIFIPPTIIFTESSAEERKRILVASVSAVDYNTLKDIVDLKWYEDETGVKKNYFSVETLEDFETKVMTPMIDTILRNTAKGETTLITLDTETTGLNIWNLSKNNPMRDHIVSLQLSWEDNQGAIMFLDMEHFNNIPTDYVMKRIEPLFRESREPVHTYKLELFRPPAQLDTLSVFSDINIGEELGAFANKFKREEVVLDRRKISLGAHNCMFDGKVCYSEGIQPYFDEDTLQMSFNLDPKLAKGSNKLKNLTRRLFGHETPELEDILGKGNEDKFRYLTDKRVAAIYGCADTDYTRLVWKQLYEMTPKQMYKSYKMQDPPLLNMLYVSEYYGLNTNEKLVKEKADLVEKDLEKLKEFIYNFVGVQLAIKSQLVMLSVQKSVNKITPEEYETLSKNIKIDPNSRYEFNIKGADLRKVLYEFLEYPVTAYTKGKKQLPSVDKIAMKKLLTKKLATPANLLTSDILSTDGSSILVAKDEFNKYKYPLAYVLSVYGNLYKEYTSYYKPIKEEDMEGKIFKGYSTTRIETRRIMNPSQTMKGDLKKLVIPYTEDYYMADFDMSQVEFRIFISDAKDTELIERMKDPEKDYHTENAALVNDIPAYMVSKKQRKSAKNIGFGLPYGLGEYSMCTNLFSTVNDDTLYETRKMIATYKDKNHKTMTRLMEYRKSALVEYDMDKRLKKFLGYDGLPLGRITNLLGFYRLFTLDNLDKRKQGIIERAAGNYPIQSFAAELFRIIIRRFYERLEREGLRDKVIVHMLIHDELLFSVHKSIHPFYLYKIIKEECMITLKGHTKYFVGINIGDSWYDCKDDKSEAPVRFVDEIVRRWDEGEFKEEYIANPKEYVSKYKDEYTMKRVHEVLQQIQPDIDSTPINYNYILDRFDNYTVRSYVDTYYKPLRDYKTRIKNLYGGKVSDKEYEDLLKSEAYLASFESWAKDFYGLDKQIIYPDGSVRTIREALEYFGSSKETEEIMLDIELEDLELDDDYWSFDDYTVGESLVEIAYNNDFDSDEDYLGYDVDLNVKDAKSVADLTIKKKPTYEMLSIINGQIIIKVNRVYEVNKIKSFLLPYKDTEGYPTLFKTSLGLQRGFCVRKTVNLEELDNYIKGVI